MIIKELRRHQTAVAIKNYLVAYLSAIGFEFFSDFYGTESDPKKFTVRFKNHQKMQVTLSDDPAKSDNFTFSLYLLKDGVNYEYITFSFEKGDIFQRKYVIKHRFDKDHCDLEQTIYLQDEFKIAKLTTNFTCFNSDFQRDLSEESSDFDILKNVFGYTLPQADGIVCQTTQKIDEPVLESHFGPDVIASIISHKGGVMYG